MAFSLHESSASAFARRLLDTAREDDKPGFLALIRQ
jgi:hypothetical protein